METMLYDKCAVSHKFSAFLLVPIVLFVILMIGYLVPALLISNGAENYQGEDKRRAESAILTVESHLSTPSFYKMYTTKFKVVDVKPTESTECGDYEAIVHGYTYFGIHFQKWGVGTPHGCPGLID
jgi:hypothetical protein